MVFGNLVSVSAATLNTASLELSDPRSSQSSSYTVTASGFTTGTLIKCLEVDLDLQADGAGGAVTGINTASQSFDSSSVLTPASWTEDVSTNGTLRITSVAGENPAASGNLIWSGVTNGSAEGTTYYALVSTYTDVVCSSSVVDSVTMAFVYTDGELVTLTIDPTLTFSVSAVAAPGSVNGATLNTDSTASGIDYLPSVVTSSANGISSHDLGVTTNASGGYNVYIRHTAQLTNSSSDVIANHAGTNGTPLAFTAAGTEGWGYTTEDTDLSQFQPNLWAGFSTSNELVMTNSVATAGTETVRVGQQVGIATDTPAGTYQSTIIYTVVAEY
jgi:hypothetical protein